MAPVVSLRVDPSDLLRGLNDLQNRHLPQIEVWALNWTADDALNAVKDRMRVVFDRPTPFTLNAFQVWRATRSNRVAVVQERPSAGRRHFLKVQERGGARPLTGMEKLMAEKVVTAQILRSVIPATGGTFESAQLDAYGNWSRGERNKVLSQLQSQRDAAANETAASRRRKKGARYFVPRHGLAPGVYRRDTPDAIPVRVLKFSDKIPQYAPRLDFEGEVTRIYNERLAENLRRAFDRARQTAR